MINDDNSGRVGVADQALVNQAPTGLGRSGFDPSRFDVANIDYAALSSGCPDQPTRQKRIEVSVVARRCVYVNNYRIAGGKPYYSENLPSHELTTSLGDVLDAFSEADIRRALREKNATRQYYAAFHDWKRSASAIEARSDATGTGAAEGESAVGESRDAQPKPQSLLNQEKPK